MSFSSYLPVSSSADSIPAASNLYDRRLEAIQTFRNWQSRFSFPEISWDKKQIENDATVITLDPILARAFDLLLIHFRVESIEELGFSSEEYFWKQLKHNSTEENGLKIFPTLSGILCSLVCQYSK